MMIFNLVLLFGLFILRVNASDNGNFDDVEEIIGNPDDTAEIDRPCQVYDIYCIRKFFYNHANCEIAKGPIPDPLIRTQANNDIPNSNLTSVINEVLIRGLNKTRVEEFYINKKTNKLIIALAFRDVNMFVPTTHVSFYRRGREPITTFLTSADVTYSDFTITAIIPNVDDLQLDKAEMTAYSNEERPVLVISPTASDPPEPAVMGGIASVYADLRNFALEVFLTDAPYLSSNYIQSNICDFGLKVL